MKISEIKGEAALDALAEIIDPATEILNDPEVKTIYKSGQPKLLLIKYLLKNHKKPLIKIMATLEGTPVEDYEFNLITLPVKLLELMNDPDLMVLFQSQGQSEKETSSGSATESTEATN